MEIEILDKVIFWFMLYSVTGWVYETMICSISARRFINRGFLNGPYCPIYGMGALLVLLILGRIENVVLLFVLGVVVTCSLEYLTSYLMEKLFHARWWDYSERKFNIAGRVCLLGAVVFGAFTVLVIKFVHPLVSDFTLRIPQLLVHWIAVLFSVGFGADLMVTVSGFADFSIRLEKLADTLAELRIETTDKIRASSTMATLNAEYEEFMKKLNGQQRRMLSAFPKLRSIKHNPVLSEIKERIRRKKGK